MATESGFEAPVGKIYRTIGMKYENKTIERTMGARRDGFHLHFTLKMYASLRAPLKEACVRLPMKFSKFLISFRICGNIRIVITESKRAVVNAEIA